MRFCPTGGISPANYRDYLALKNVLCIGGSWLVPNEALEAGDWQRITQLASEAVAGPANGQTVSPQAHRTHLTLNADGSRTGYRARNSLFRCLGAGQSNT